MNTAAVRPEPVDRSHNRFNSFGILASPFEDGDDNFIPEPRLSQLASPPDSSNEADGRRDGYKKWSTPTKKVKHKHSRNKLSVQKETLSEAAEIDATARLLHTRPAPTLPTIRDTLSPKDDFVLAAVVKERTINQDVSEVHKETPLKLSPDKLRELTLAPDSLPIRPVPYNISSGGVEDNVAVNTDIANSDVLKASAQFQNKVSESAQDEFEQITANLTNDYRRPRNLTIETSSRGSGESTNTTLRPQIPKRTLSTPASIKSPMFPKKDNSRTVSATSDTSFKNENLRAKNVLETKQSLPSPMPQSIPLPPLSIPTYLQLELSSHRPSQLYIHRSASSDFPYESSRVKIERLLNFLLLPPHLEVVLWFGTLACLDAWLYTFTILPLRLLKSLYILGQSWIEKLFDETQFVSRFIYGGVGRVWRRRNAVATTIPTRHAPEAQQNDTKVETNFPSRNAFNLNRHHRRAKSVPSLLLPDDKADLLKGLLIICTTLILLRFDASRMYHWIRGQAAIKLYVIYNLLEVCDRLFSAIGQDVLECLFSREALERKPDGHSKVLRPLWLFVVALTYTVIHSTALFYQVITLNVAVNSYSNALITLLMSNQFVEIKSTVFKKFEKENLFQLTCADVVERFQLWHMLVIIASRNIVETGGLSRGLNMLASASTTSTASNVSNSSIPFTMASPPLTVSSILPRSFTLVPAVVASITSYVPAVSHVLGPFLVVLGSEMLVDWLKHAYIIKFNNTRPAIYDRFLDVLAKDYYTNAFGDQNLTKRLGLPVIPLSCLLIRAGVQSYQMFMAIWIPTTTPSSTTSLTSIHQHYTAARTAVPTSTAAKLTKAMDEMLYGIPSSIANSQISNYFTTVLICLLIFLVLLACKLILGMLLLSFARSRYKSMKEREKESIHHVEGGRRVGGWGVVEVDEDKRRWIYEDDPAGMRGVREREEKDRIKREKDKSVGIEGFEKVRRYEMVAKRIW